MTDSIRGTFFLYILVCIISMAMVPISHASSASYVFEGREKLGEVLFRENSSELTDLGREAIDEVIAKLKFVDPADKIVRIEGFASITGTDKYNFLMSKMRAKAVLSYISQHHSHFQMHYLTFFYGNPSQLYPSAPGNKVEIAVYDNIFLRDNSEIEHIVIR